MSQRPSGPSPHDDFERAANILDELGIESRPKVPASDELDALCEAATAIGEHLDVSELLPQILRYAIEHSGADYGILFYFARDSDEAVPCTIARVSQDEITEAASYSQTVLDLARARTPIHSQDAAADPRFKDAKSIGLNDIRSIACIPLVHSSRVTGAFYLDTRKSNRRIDPRSMRFLHVLASLSAVAISNAERFSDVKLDNDRLRREIISYEPFDDIVGQSEPMVRLSETLRRVAASDFPVFVAGESGTGKELVARALHRVSSNADGPFIAQNCAAVPADLLETEFFGHTKGAFTGAERAKDGLFLLANGGTLFLDEIGDLALHLQAKLLRVLEDGLIRPVGSVADVKSSFRLVSATSVDLEAKVDEGSFRRDLFYRLNVVIVRVPPLRERTDDIPLLVKHFIDKHRSRAGDRQLRFSAAAIRALREKEWRGNVRELEHFVKRALVLCPNDDVSPDDLLTLDGDATPATRSHGLPVGHMTLLEMEQEAVQEALRRTGGNKTRAAKLLGLNRNALARRLEKFDSSDTTDAEN